MTRRASRPLVFAAGAVLALTAACGGSDQASSAAGSSAASTSASAAASTSASAAVSTSASASTPATPPASTPASTSAGASASTSVTPTVPAPPSPAPTGAAPASSVAAATPGPGLTIPPGLPTAGGDGGTAPGAGESTDVPQVAPVDPAKGQTFLDALHAGGLPAGPTDQINLQYAPVICASLAQGASPESVRSELVGVGQLYQSIAPLTPDQVADLFLTAARTTYC